MERKQDQEVMKLNLIFFWKIICNTIHSKYSSPSKRYGETGEPNLPSPFNCFIAGLDHPPNGVQSEKEYLPSLWTYHSYAFFATSAHFDLPPIIYTHNYKDV